MNTNGQLTARLQGAYSTEMADDTRRRQLSTISAALKMPPVTSTAAVPVSLRVRRRLAALVAVATVLSPAAVAVAAESSLPGDALYPVKQITEDLRSVVDPTITARHRLDEADAMSDRGFSVAAVENILREADAAIVDAGNPPDLRSRWIDTRERMGMDQQIDGIGSDMTIVPPTADTPKKPAPTEMTDRRGDPMTDEMPNDNIAPGNHSPGNDTGHGRGTRHDEQAPDTGTMNEGSGEMSNDGGSMESDSSTTGGSDMSTDPGTGQDSNMGEDSNMGGGTTDPGTGQDSNMGEDPGDTMGQDTGTTGMGGDTGTGNDGGTWDGSGGDWNG